jgi:hypothetical protein
MLMAGQADFTEEEWETLRKGVTGARVARLRRSFVLEVAESVARAAGGGEAAESGALDRIRSALGAA